ncbi:hypothetical protein BSL78_27006 [Apostichopus japonicus]|uniref:LRRNT domain-containing protein n=1 Tax=Stichopus japonicus TaxID=307972 RepID=A0A2G8JK85_STIJA|nr:hypothetical protein BSL78_27006 [Apostichopus japonicus]
MARCLFQTRGAMTLLFVSVFCYMVLVHNCRFVPRDCPEQCECSSCWPILHCDGRNVTDLNFSQSFTWVRIFSVSHTSIPDLQMGTLTLPTIAGVGSLEMIANGITILTEELFAMNYSRLQSISLQQTKLSTVPTRMMRLAPNLGNIDLSGNMITVIHSYVFTFNNDLNTILLAENGLQLIEEKAFTGVTELGTLNLSYNSIMGTNLGNWEEFHTSIETISLSGNGLRQMPTLNPNYKFSCKYLSLEHNHFEALDKFALAAFENLTLLNVENNSLSTVDGDLFGEGTHDLVMLYLSRNHLTSVPVSLLARLPKLLNLSLSFNHIATRLASVCQNKKRFCRIIGSDGFNLTIISSLLFTPCR